MAVFSSPQEAVGWMENLCRAFSNNPKEAEQALMDFRKSEHAVEVSKIILEQSQVPMAQFHAALSLQEAALARWESIPLGERRALQEYLWEFTCREWERRGWVGETEEGKMSLFALLERSSLEGGLSALRSAKALYGLVSEFGSTRATALGLPLEFFRRTHDAFSKVGLNQSLEMSMKLLGEVVTAVADPEALNNPAVVELVTVVVNVCAEVLSWEFNFVEAWQIPPTQQLIQPGPRWRPYLVRPDFLGAVFDVYQRVRLRSTGGRGGILPHSLRQLLIQLSSVHGDIFEDDHQRKEYASFLVKGATAVLAAPLSATEVGQRGAQQGVAEAAAEEAQADEYVGIASMALRLVTNFKLRTLARLESFGGFAQQLATIASRMLQQATAVAPQDYGNPWREEVFGLLLETWVAMVEDPEVGRDPALRKGMEDATFPLYEQYLAYELTVSRAEAEASCLSEEDDEEEEIGAADKDEQMCSVACLGRLSPARALAAIDIKVQGVSTALCGLLETGLVHGQPALLPGGEGLSPAATGVLEEARTAVVLAAHLMADKDDGDVMVPEVLHTAFLEDKQTADLLVELVQRLVSLLEVHVTLLIQHGAGARVGGAARRSPSPLLSPYLGGALLWCFARWASAYLLPNLTLYQGGMFSYRLTVAFGAAASSVTLSDPPTRSDRGGGGVVNVVGMGGGGGAGGTEVAGVARGGLSLAESLLRACWTCLCEWPSQPDVCTNALDLMRALVSRSKAPATTSLPLWWDIVAAYGGGAGAGAGRDEGFRRLSVDLQGVLIQRLCEGVLQRAHDSSSAREGFERVAGLVWTRLRGLLHAVGGLESAQRQSPRVVGETLLCVRLCRGVVLACGAAGGSYHHLGETFVEPTYDGMTLLLAMHVSGAQSVVYEVLQYFRDIADQQLIYMSSRRAMALYEACGKGLKIYADQHTGCVSSFSHLGTMEIYVNGYRGRYGWRVDATAEEDSYGDVLCVLELLTHLVTKDLVDQSEEAEEEKGREVVVTDVIFFGLKKVMPLMTEGLFRFPTLASQYFSLVSFVVQTYPHKLPGLELELFDQIVNSLVFGSQQADAAVARNSLQAITVMVTHHIREKMNGDEGLSGHLAAKPELFFNVLRTLVQMLVFQHFVWDRLEACALAVLPLLICEQEGFGRLAEEIVASQPENTRPRLVEAFHTLHACHGASEGGLTRGGRRRFQAGMQEFVTSIRAFLHTK